MSIIPVMQNSAQRFARALALAALALANPAQAQDSNQNSDKGMPVDRTVESWIDLSAGGVVASGRSFDADEDEDKSGGIFAAEYNLRTDTGPNRFDVTASSAYYAYTDEGRSDRWSNALSLAYGRQVSDTVELSVMARGATRLSTLESSEADEARLLGRVEYLNGNSRLRITGGWRSRNYQNRAFGTGDGPMAEVEYRHRIGRGNYILAEAIYDAIDSDDVPRLTYDRLTLRGAGRIRLNKRLDLDLGLRYRDWSNKYRLIGTEKRSAHSFAPEVELTYEFDKDWTLSAGGSVSWRNSNDPDYERNVYRGFLTLEKRFWLRR